MSIKKAIYPFSGDPITKGHINIIERALNVFDEVIVGIGVNPDKKYTFSLEDRKKLAEKVLEPFLPRVSVKAFEGLLVDFAFENNIKTIIRGVRNTPDFSFEQLLHDVNQSQDLGVETYILIADKKYAHVSSSAVKELQRNQGQNIIDYVPMVVKKALEEQVSGQSIFGVTGEIGAGKSYVTESIIQYLRSKSVVEADPVHNIDLDAIGREILTTAQEPIYKKTRYEIIKAFTTEIIGPNENIDIKKLTGIIFSDVDKRRMFDSIMYEPMYLMLRKKMHGKRGLILVNSALIVEANMLEFVNNNVLLITSDKDLRIKKLSERGYSSEEIERRMNAQFSYEEKWKQIRESINEHGYGNLITFRNDYTNISSTAIHDLIKQIKGITNYYVSF